MIDEQSIFFARIKRWEELSSPGVHALGIVDWIGPLEAIAKPVDFKTKSVLEVVACYMESTGNGNHAHLLRRSFSRLLHDCRKLALEELKSKNMEELTVIYRERGPLWHSRQSNTSLCHAIGDMVISFRDDSFESKESFDETVAYLEKVNPSGGMQISVELPASIDNQESNLSLEPMVTISKKDLRILAEKSDQGMTKRYKNGNKWGYFNITETTVDITQSAYLALKNMRSLRT
jgi:hypothetical protein